MTGFAAFAELLHDRAARRCSEVVYSFTEHAFSVGENTGSLTYGELDERARAIAARLQSEGIRRGDRVLVLQQPGLDLIGALFGCFYAGAIALLLPPPRNANTSLPGAPNERLFAIARDAAPARVLTTQTHVQLIAPLLAGIPVTNTTEIQAAESGEWREAKTAHDDIALLQYTSGSTAQPKGVMLSHENLLHNSRLIQETFGHSEASRGVIWLPPYHDMGLIGGILQPLFCGFPVTLFSPTDFLMRPLRWLQLITSTRATTSGGPNFAYDLCTKKIGEAQKADLDLSSWRAAFCGAEPVRAATLENFAAAFAECGFTRRAFLPCYGLAEHTLLASGIKDADAPRTTTRENRVLVSCGSAPQGVELRIVDPETSTSLPDGETGEIWVRSASAARGYWNRDTESRETFHARLADDSAGDGPFLRTGDLGFLQNDELFVTGRHKDLMIFGGRNHHPEDIEYSVQSRCDAVRACGAFSVDDVETGAESLIIAVEIERRTGEEYSVQSVSAAIRETVAAKHELRVANVLCFRPSSLPRTPSGKIQRHRCRKLFLSGAWTGKME